MSVAKTAIIIVIISLMGKIIGCLREILLANYFGTSSVVDAYLMSITIPEIVFGFLPAISVGVTPIYYDIKDNKKRNSFINNILFLTIGVAFIFVLIASIFKKNLVLFCAPGFNDGLQDLTVTFLSVTVWSLLFNTPVKILTAYLNCNNNYINSNLSNLFVSITQALFIVLAAKTYNVFLAVGVVLPWVFQLIWLFRCSQAIGFAIERPIGIDGNVIRLTQMVTPLFISSILVDLNGFVDKLLSSSLATGRLAALNYAFTLRAVFVTIATMVISTIIYPKIAELIINYNNREIGKSLFRYIDFVSFFIIPICFMCYFFSEEIVGIVLMHGHFDHESLKNTAVPFKVYSLSLCVIVWRELIIRVMYSDGRTNATLKYSAIEVFFNIVLSLVLVKYYEQVGLALATSIASVVSFPFYLKELKNYSNKDDIFLSLSKLIKITIASILSVIIMFAINGLDINIVPNNRLKFIGIVVIGIVSFVMIASIFKIEEAKDIIKNTKNSLKHR